MVARAGGNYGEAFRGFGGVTQGYPLSPPIFNVVVDAVMCNWVSLVAVGAGGPDGCGKKLLHRSAFFYVYNSLVAPTDSDWL